jgi:ABC-type Fe3+-hydroxamate transport system substrate-binding protein
MAVVKPLIFLALSTAFVMGLLQACSSADPHPTTLTDCVGTNCTIPTSYPDAAKLDGTIHETSVDTSVLDTSTADAGDAGDVGIGDAGDAAIQDAATDG